MRRGFIAVFAAALFAAPCARASGEARAASGYLPPAGRVVRPAARRASARRLLKTASQPPASWDSREHGLVTSVKNQGGTSTCWAFAACSTLETQLLREGGAEADFSEKNMAMRAGFVPDPNSGGGNYDMAAAYLLRWDGAIADALEPLTTPWDFTWYYPPACRVQNTVWIPPRESADDNETLKRAVMQYGAVGVDMYYGTGSYKRVNGAFYCNETNATKCVNDHAVVVVGWDDSYASTNFLSSRRPSGDGAWLVKNSHGATYNDNGYLHVSYYDTRFFTGPWTSYGQVFIPAAEDEDYCAAYGYDRLGAVFYGSSGDEGFQGEGEWKIAALFGSSWNEELAAVGLYSVVAPLDYKLEIWTNATMNSSTANPTSGGALALVQNGTLSTPGFSTIHLDEPVPLADGTTFTVVFQNTAEDICYFALCASAYGYSEVSAISNRTFYSRSAAGAWRDSAKPQNSASLDLQWKIGGASAYPAGNICLKAFTRSTRKLNEPPPEDFDGYDMLAGLKAASPERFYSFGGSFGAIANIVGANGRTLWTSWLAGLDPSNPAESAFTAMLTFTNGVPYLSWTPDLGGSRLYTTWAKDTLDDSWRQVQDNDLSLVPDARFFKVSIDQLPID